MRTLGRVLAVLPLLASAGPAMVTRVEVDEESFTPASAVGAGVAALLGSVAVTCVRVTTDDLASARVMAAEFALTPEDNNAAASSGRWDSWVGWLPSAPGDEPVSLRVDAYRASGRVA